MPKKSNSRKISVAQQKQLVNMLTQVKKKKAKPKVISGRGAYAYGRGKYSFGRALGGALGGMAGMALGQPGLGSMAGRSLGGLVQRKVSGRGAYRTNDLVNGGSPSSLIPSFGTPDENGNIRIRHKEYIGDIFSPTIPGNFNIQSFSLNPALVGVFPWLSQTASNYDEYEFQGLIFTYNPVISDSSNSGAMGTVIMATVYNAASSPFGTKQQMLEYSGSVSARICDTMVHGIECDPKKHGGSGIEYTRAGAVPTGQDIKTYDLGIFQIATSGVSSTSFPVGTQLGELWVSYDVILSKPKFWDNLGYSILTDAFYGIVGDTLLTPLGTAPFKSANNTIGGTISKAGNTTYTFPDNFSGYVQCCFFVNTTLTSTLLGTSIAQAGNISTGECQFYIRSGPVASHNVWSSSSIATQSSIITAFFRVSPATIAGGNNLVLSVSAVTGTFNFCQFVVQECNPLIGPAFQSNVPSNYVAA